MNTAELTAVEPKRHESYVYTQVSTSPENPSETVNSGLAERSAQDRIIFNSQVNKIFETMSNEKGSKSLQYFASIAGNLCVVAGGAALGWTSSSLLKLGKNNPIADDNPLGVAIVPDESSWIGSLAPVGGLVGSLFAGHLAERYGRKTTLLFSTILFTISWTLIAAATTVEMLYLARFIVGLALSIPFTVLPMYTGEIAETSIRGFVGSLLQPFISFGLLWAYCIGPYVSYTIFWMSCVILPIVFFAIFFTMPESPYYLSAQGNYDEVIRVLAKLRGKSINAVKAEAHQIQKTVEEAYKCEATFMDLFRVRINFKALLLSCTLIIFQQFTGINVVVFYSQMIFDAAGTSDTIPSAISTIIVGVFSLVPSCITPFIVDRWGRKVLLNGSAIGQTISLIALGSFFYLLEYGDVSKISWLPVASLITYIVSYSVGWGPLPWTVMGEIFASDIKSKASSVTTFVSWSLAFAITKYFSKIAELLGMHTAFWFFAVCCAFSVLFTVFLLPETNGKSLEQIQAELAGSSSDAVHHNEKKDFDEKKYLP